MTSSTMPARAAESVIVGEWLHPYSRELAAYPATLAGSTVDGGFGATRADKYWPPVRRVDQAFGDRNLVCACPPISAFAEQVTGSASA